MAPAYTVSTVRPAVAITEIEGDRPAGWRASMTPGTSAAMRPSTRLWPYLLLTLAGVAWGFGFPLGKLALRELPPPHMIVLRLGIAAVVALPFVLFAPAARRMVLTDRWSWATGVFYGLGFLLQFAGLSKLTVSLAALLIGLMPALVAAASVLWGEKVGGRGWLGVAAATVGAGVIALGAGGAGGSFEGVTWSLGSLLIFLGYVWGVTRMQKTDDLLAGPAVVVVIGALSASAVAIPLWGAPSLHLQPVTWAALLGQGLVSTAIATAAWQIASVRTPTASAGVFINLEPLVGAFIGVAGFGDPVTLPLVAGGLLILGGSLVTVLSPQTGPIAAEPA